MDVKLKSIPNQDFVCGFPGIPATWPRIEGTVEIRSTKLSVMEICQVHVALYRTDSIAAPSSRSGNIYSSRREKSYLIGEKLQLYQGTSAQVENPSHAVSIPINLCKYDPVLGLDLNFVLPLPVTKHLPSSISLHKRTVETSYQLFVSVIHGKSTLQTTHYPFPIRLKRYDKLSTFGQFHVPLKGNVVSPDHLVEFEYSIPQSSFGPRDSIVSYVKISPNLDLYSKSRKIKLNKLSVQVVEVITYNVSDLSSNTSQSLGPTQSNDSTNGASSPNTKKITKKDGKGSLLPSASKDSSDTTVVTVNNSFYHLNLETSNSNSNPPSSNTGPIERRRKLCKATNTLDCKLPENGYRCEITMDFPSQDLREPKDHPGGVIPFTSSTHPATNSKVDIPLSCISTGFTTSAPLYRVEYLLVFKAKFSHSKDILIEQPITVTPFEHVMCVSLMKSIKDAVDDANKLANIKDEYILNSTYLYNLSSSISNMNKNKKENDALYHKKHRSEMDVSVVSDIFSPDLIDPSKRFFVPKIYRPHDPTSLQAYGLTPTGPLDGNHKPTLLIK